MLESCDPETGNTVGYSVMFTVLVFVFCGPSVCPVVKLFEVGILNEPAASCISWQDVLFLLLSKFLQRHPNYEDRHNPEDFHRPKECSLLLHPLVEFAHRKAEQKRLRIL